MIDHVIEHCHQKSAVNLEGLDRSSEVKILDLCCGSGAIGVSILNECPEVGIVSM